MSFRLADRLLAARRRYFVGRLSERELFRTALAAADLPFLVLYVLGPGGMGKSSLLREFSSLATETQIPVCYLDARNFEPAPEAFLSALRATLPTLPNDLVSPLFLAAIEATEEAIYNSLFCAITVTGYRGRTVEALPLTGWLPPRRPTTDN